MQADKHSRTQEEVGLKRESIFSEVNSSACLQLQSFNAHNYNGVLQLCIYFLLDLLIVTF